VARATVITVNGKRHTITSKPDTPLLYVLRNELGLHATKFGCGLAQCGACAVLVGGTETRSCVTPVSSVDKPVTTLEGLPARWAEKHKSSSHTLALHPVQQAWIDEQVPQCGYCQSGMMIMAVDLLERNPSPDDGEIRKAFTDTPPSPHLCRCGTYDSMVKAITRASTTMKETP
jgi:isoquinoline 1-oxidoreductase alpha subunit